MTTVDVDRAVVRLLRRLDKIMACSSGMGNFPQIEKKVTALRGALAEYAPKKVA